jgi:RHS repeat-associated protein
VCGNVSRNPHRGSGGLSYDLRRRPWIGETVTTYSDGSPSSVQTTDFVYDGNQIVLQFDATSTPGSPVSLTANNLSHRYLSGPAVDQVLADERVTLQSGSLVTDKVLWTLADAQGTVRDVALLSGTTTAVKDHIIYSSFGNVVNESDPSYGCLCKYAGRPTDTATGLENNRARIYDAALTRFISEDPTSLTAGDTNLDRYCEDDPINATDPSGLWPVDIWTSVNNHELMTYEAARKAGYEIDATSLFRAPKDQAFAQGLGLGVRWVDMPDGLSGLWLLSDYLGGRVSRNELRRRYPPTYETHVGELVYRHGMAPHKPDGSLVTKDPQELKKLIIYWIMAQYNIARKVTGEAQGMEIGKACHTIEDLYSPAHVIRNPVATGAITRFQDYDAQDPAKHDQGDERATNETTAACWDQAVRMTAVFLTILHNNAKPAQVEAWLKGPTGPLVLAPNCEVGGSANEYSK